VNYVRFNPNPKHTLCECGRPLNGRPTSKGCAGCEASYNQYIQMRVRLGLDTQEVAA